MHRCEQNVLRCGDRVKITASAHRIKEEGILIEDCKKIVKNPYGTIKYLKQDYVRVIFDVSNYSFLIGYSILQPTNRRKKGG